MKKKILILLLFAMLLALVSCGRAGTQTDAPEGAGSNGGADTAAVAGDYYLDLSELGMKLTIYLRLSDDGNFLFSNTPEFQVNKSSGTFQESGGEYVMVFTSVNGEDKSISDGLTGSFFVTNDGCLDFTSCERIYYGSASATTTSDEHPGAKLTGVPIPPDYEAPSNDTEFKSGFYTFTEETDGTTVEYAASFFEDDTYILRITRRTESGTEIFSEAGRYGVSTTQLAMEPEGGRRISNEVIDAETLEISVPAKAGEDRRVLEFKRSDDVPVLMELAGTTFSATLIVYADGSFQTNCDGFTEGGVLVMSTGDSACKIYPDHPETGVRGLSSVTTVPAGGLSVSADGSVVLEDFRVRRSESLNRDKCTFE